MVDLPFGISNPENITGHRVPELPESLLLLLGSEALSRIDARILSRSTPYNWGLELVEGTKQYLIRDDDPAFSDLLEWLEHNWNIKISEIESAINERLSEPNSDDRAISVWQSSA